MKQSVDSNSQTGQSDIAGDDRSSTLSKDGTVASNTSSTSSSNLWMRRSRCLVLSFLLVASGVVGYLGYRVATNQETKTFEHDYESVGEEVLEESEIRARSVFGAIKTMSTVASTMVASSSSSMDWPYVTLPKFEAWAGGLNLALTGADSLTFGVIVNESQRVGWSNYSTSHADAWVQESIELYKEVVIPDSSSSEDGQKGEQNESGSYDDIASSDDDDERRRRHLHALRVLSQQMSSDDDEEEGTDSHSHEEEGVYDIHEATSEPITHYVWSYLSDGSKGSAPPGTAAVNWQMTPVDTSMINHDEFETFAFKKAFEGMENDKQSILTEIVNGPLGHISFLFQPIFRVIESNTQEATDIVGYFKAALPWDTYFKNLLPENKSGIHVVVENTCGQAITYELDGKFARFVGDGDLHDPKYNAWVFEEEFDPLELFKGRTSGCEYGIHLYPTDKFVQGYSSNKPTLYAVVGVLAVLFAACIFLIYDWSVRKRQRDITEDAKRSHAIVNSLFPANVRSRLFENNKTTVYAKRQAAGDVLTALKKTPFGVLKTENSRGVVGQLQIRESKPIADLFPSATVLFADIAGFTAWSSVREPSQVFMLLEAIYDSFDQIAKHVGVFKVETIGDCYVAACGLPSPRVDHAVVMADFARKCMAKMKRGVVELEVLLGPGTADLGMRFGLHSGPVMAGVLRGEKSRFQLFGDTVNTCSRIEATGAKNRIHLSQQTANLLVEAGKSKWVRPRSSLVTAKGKGSMKTWWCFDNAIQPTDADPTTMKNITSISPSTSETTEPEWCGDDTKVDVRMGRLIDFNTEILGRLLKKMVAIRYSKKRGSNIPPKVVETAEMDGFVIDEVKEIIRLPSEPVKYNIDPDDVNLDLSVTTQLRHYVSTIASMYHDNPFHSFYHATHVSMSATKLLSRVVTQDTIDYSKMAYTAKGTSTKLHDFTYGITSDPLTQFAVAFSCLIHDVDHPGVPNAQLVKEETDIAKQYRNQSVAEQNSVDISWDLLNEPVYAELRRCIYTNQSERDRFRQLVVNAVMATDIVDKPLKELRNKRWATAFSDIPVDENPLDAINRKATIVIEHLIQASDVSHTMQHWHVYMKWNKRFFNECYSAYLSGRAEKDPSEGWYQGEIGFFDFYIIPLAKKLKECGVFGVSSDEYLDYAMANRNEWEQKGKALVAEYVADFEKESGNSSLHSSSKSLQETGTHSCSVDSSLDTSSVDFEVSV